MYSQAWLTSSKGEQWLAQGATGYALTRTWPPSYFFLVILVTSLS
jgi:hypothetical protein